jgi:flagella basal body P-ring formation protein FlgA
MKDNFVNKPGAVVLLLLLLGASLAAGAADPNFETHDNIVMTVSDYVNEALKGNTDKEVIISPLNKNLRLVRCSQPLEAFITPGIKLSGRSTVGVRCDGHKPWKIYVNVLINIFDNVVIADDYILRGSEITATQIRTEKRNVATLNRGYFTSPEDVTGKIARSVISKEKVITPFSLTEPKLVHRGKDVTIVAESDDFMVKMNGSALADGHKGELIKVKNLRSQRVIQAEVIDDNLVRVTM